MKLYYSTNVPLAAAVLCLESKAMMYIAKTEVKSDLGPYYMDYRLELKWLLYTISIGVQSVGYKVQI